MEAGSIDTGFAMRDGSKRTSSELLTSPSARVTEPITLDVEVNGTRSTCRAPASWASKPEVTLDRCDFGLPFDQAPGGIMVAANRIGRRLDEEAHRRP